MVVWRDEIIELLQKPIEADDDEAAAEKAPSEGGSSGVDVITAEPVQSGKGEDGGRRTRSKAKGPVVETEQKEPQTGIRQSEGKDGNANGDAEPAETDLYTQRLETQIKLESYLIAYEAIVADRKGSCSSGGMRKRPGRQLIKAEMMDEQRNAIAQQEAGKVTKGVRPPSFPFVP